DATVTGVQTCALPILVPVRIEDVVPTESLAYFIGTVHWLDAMTPPFENHLVKLADSLKGLLEVNPPKHLAGTAPFTPPPGAGARSEERRVGQGGGGRR